MVFTHLIDAECVIRVDVAVHILFRYYPWWLCSGAAAAAAAAAGEEDEAGREY